MPTRGCAPSHRSEIVRRSITHYLFVVCHTSATLFLAKHHPLVCVCFSVDTCVQILSPLVLRCVLIRADFSFSPFSADRKVLMQGGCQLAEMKNREKRENAKNAQK